MSIQVQLGHAVGLTGALIDLASGAYYNSRVNLRTARIAVDGKWEEVEDQTGEIGSIIATGDFLQMEFDVLPEGATRQAAFEGVRLPARGTAFNASGFGSVAIPLGPFTASGINNTGTPSPAGDTQPWIFHSGEVAPTSTEKWTARWTMRRYKNVTTGAAVS